MNKKTYFIYKISNLIYSKIQFDYPDKKKLMVVFQFIFLFSVLYHNGILVFLHSSNYRVLNLIFYAIDISESRIWNQIRYYLLCFYVSTLFYMQKYKNYKLIKIIQCYLTSKSLFNLNSYFYYI